MEARMKKWMSIKGLLCSQAHWCELTLFDAHGLVHFKSRLLLLISTAPLLLPLFRPSERRLPNRAAHSAAISVYPRPLFGSA